MCGICGVIQIGGPLRPIVPPEVIDRMTDAMAHRGPSDRGIVNEAGVALGARRLSIIDVEGGHQPFANEDGRVWAAQNGELYNHDLLRSELRRDGHVIHSRCDTEVIPHLYERYGERFAGHLEGKFAIVVWDGAAQRGVLARDRLGIKPLYYAQRGDRLVFASELKSILASGLVDAELDVEAIGAYLQFGFVPAPRTPLAGVRKLRPGHRLVIDADGVREVQYWEFPKPAPDRSMSEADAQALLMDELEAAVRRRLMSDVPLGAMLSGGLDSSLIVALMARNSRDAVKTFSVGLADAGRQNELGEARRVAELFGTDHHELELSSGEDQVSIEDLSWWLDEPVVDLSALGFLTLSKLAASHVTVALSGQGADEMLGGYSRYMRAALVGHAHRLPAPARSALAASLRAGGGRYGRFAAAITAVDAATRQLQLRPPWVDSELFPRLARGQMAATGETAALRAVRAHADGLEASPLNACLYLDSQLTLVDDLVHYFDRTSMAHSLEVRVPFLDHHVVELCSRIPESLKVRGIRTKYLLKKAASELLPSDIVHKRKIGFFNGSMATWTRTQLQGPAGEYLLQGELACGELLDRDTVRGLARAAVDGKTADLGALHAILMLEVWLSSTLPRALAAPLSDRELMVRTG